MKMFKIREIPLKSNVNIFINHSQRRILKYICNNSYESAKNSLINHS